MEKRGLLDVENRLVILKEIAESLNEANDVSMAMEAILPKLGEALGLETAWAFRFDEQRHSFVEVGASGLPPALDCCGQSVLRSGGCECQNQFVDGELNTAVNIVRCSRLKSAKGDTRDLRFHASIPLRSKDSPLGILNVAAPGRTVFTEDALSFLQTVGQQVAVAMDRARMLQTERDRAMRLAKLASVAAQSWVRDGSPQKLLQGALEDFVEAFSVPVCGVIDCRGVEEREPEVIAVAECTKPSNIPQVYPRKRGDDSGHDCRSILLAHANSGLSVPLPMTSYRLRVESPMADAFTHVDEEVLQAFSWHLATAYVNAQLYSQGLEAAHWNERRRIASDLHDSVSQRLFSAQLLTRTVQTKLSGGDPGDNTSVRSTVTRIGELLAESQAEMRDLIRTLRPPQPFACLIEALQSRVRTLAMHPEPRVLFMAPEVLQVEPPAHVREALLAVADEALHNALKHADASTIVVRLEERTHMLSMCIEDDGKGCLPSDIGKGLGTRTMGERAEAVGGKVSITGHTGGGTKVKMTIPRFNQAARGDV
ncbi:GAF domain-containing sensor histidine kinase [Alicyclobacillus dauci]|uniref:histidine kinase n=1 Tax=Alicyclobacillus dauci TaxID=1475485 RepID=A0ABY6Z021_9BACL|nr:GAF domain-containing sensor histidine kinase [Alicyclobacillus dauci]WAH36225.1 GAF domain-containing sensor histidine kinase [Alicyclobacillus dauci]